MDQFAVLLVVYSPAGTGRSSPFYSVDVISRDDVMMPARSEPINNFGVGEMA